MPPEGFDLQCCAVCNLALKSCVSHAIRVRSSATSTVDVKCLNDMHLSFELWSDLAEIASRRYVPSSYIIGLAPKCELLLVERWLTRLYLNARRELLQVLSMAAVINRDSAAN